MNLLYGLIISRDFSIIFLRFCIYPVIRNSFFAVHITLTILTLSQIFTNDSLVQRYLALQTIAS